jgi:phosphoglycerate kinase
MNYATLYTLDTLPVTGKQVFLRADLNIPLAPTGEIVDDFRLRALVPTLDLLVKKQAKIILATHIGRPTGPTHNLSTRLLVPWFTQAGYIIEYAHTLGAAHEISNNMQPGTIVLLENLRFFAGEQTADKHFAQDLRRLANYYVNDAFGVLHRTDTSVTLMPELYTCDHKSIGLLIKRELEMLSYLKHDPAPPFLLILGGGKVKDKLPMLAHLLHTVNAVALCPAVAFTFLRALGQPIGKSLVEESLLDSAQDILHKAHALGVQILFPLDYQFALNTLNGPLICADTMPDNGIGLAIGPQTIEFYARKINQAQTIFLNGAMGIQERPASMQALYALLQAIAQSSAMSIVGGGESVAAVYLRGLNKAINFCSTGGGATLAYLSNQPLPGLVSMC